MKEVWLVGRTTRKGYKIVIIIGFGTFCSKIRLLCSALMFNNLNYYAPGLYALENVIV